MATPQATEVLGYYRPLGSWDAWWRKLILLLGVGLLVLVSFKAQENSYHSSDTKLRHFLRDNPITEDWYGEHKKLEDALPLFATRQVDPAAVAYVLDENIKHLRDVLQFIEEWDIKDRYNPFVYQAREVFEAMETARQKVKYHYGVSEATATEVQNALNRQKALMRLFIDLGGGHQLWVNYVNYFMRGVGRRQ